MPVALDQPLDIVLEAGEQVRQIVDGDRAPAEQGQTRRWEVQEGGDGVRGRTPAACLCDGDEAGLTNGITITTTRRIYYIACKSVAKSPMRVLRWHYPPERADDASGAGGPRAAARILTSPMRYHVGYEIKPRASLPRPGRPGRSSTTAKSSTSSTRK